MSDGFFEYPEYTIKQITDSISEIIENNNSKESAKVSGVVGQHYPKEVIEKFEDAIQDLQTGLEKAHLINRLLTNDTGHESFLSAWKSKFK